MLASSAPFQPAVLIGVGLRRLHAQTGFCAIDAVLVAAGVLRRLAAWIRFVMLAVEEVEHDGGLWLCMSHLFGGLAGAFIWLVKILGTAVVSSSSLLLGLGWAWGWSAGFFLGACGGRRLGGVGV